VTVNLTAGTALDGFGDTDTLANFENVKGSVFTDVITGNVAANVLEGLAGNDRLDGMAGKDKLMGGAGEDTFAFTTALAAANVDQITDFNVVDDTIQLENGVFTALTTTGALAAGAFRIGAAAADADDRIIYNSATGDLFYDSNGNAAGGSVQFADLATGLALTAADFLVS
jgi:Ca2+-binding RTX toxin-like protein